MERTYKVVRGQEKIKTLVLWPLTTRHARTHARMVILTCHSLNGDRRNRSVGKLLAWDRNKRKGSCKVCTASSIK